MSGLAESPAVLPALGRGRRCRWLLICGLLVAFPLCGRVRILHAEGWCLQRSEGGTRTDGVGSMGALSSDWDAGGLAVEDEEVMLARAIEESLKCQE